MKTVPLFRTLLSPLQGRIAVLLFLILGCCRLGAAPFAEFFNFKQADGTQITVWGEGDEFSAFFETQAGHTVIFDGARNNYYYASVSADGNQLIATDVPANQYAPVGLAKHLRPSKSAILSESNFRRKQWDAATGNSAQWESLKALQMDDISAKQRAGIAYAPPSTTTVGDKVGLTLLIDFSDDPATITRDQIDAYCNGDSYAEFSNNGSVKKYFQDVSNGRLNYTNVVTAYIRMTQPKSYYNDTNKDSGEQGRLLINDALAIMKALPEYETVIKPTFANLTVNASNQVVACNVFFAGATSGAWSKGLWPHSWSLASNVSLNNGFSVRKYQITNVGTSIKIRTFCHENGHMLCGFPDIYDYDSDSIGGAGKFCIMNSGSSDTNPSQVCAYLKSAAGWATITDLYGQATQTLNLIAAPDAGYNTFYRYRKPNASTEYYLIENRQRTGRDASLPAAGIAVWHIDQLGNKNEQSIEPNTIHRNYECTLVQADNQWHFQNNNNSGDVRDLYYLGNTAAGYTNTISDATAPHAHWWDGTNSNFKLTNFSANAQTMTVTFESSVANDNFSAATLIHGPSYAFSINNAPGTMEAGEPAHAGNAGGHSLWWRWVAPASGAATFTTTGSGIDTVLGVYTGAAVGALTAIGSNDDTAGITSSVTFNAVSGTTYYIAVDGKGGATGSISLNLTFAVPTTVITLTSHSSPPEGDSYSMDIYSNTTWTVSSDQTWVRSSRISGTGNSSTTITVSPQSVNTTRTATLTVGGRTHAITQTASPVVNDLFSNASSIAGMSARVTGTNVNAVREAGEPEHADKTGDKSVWWRWNAPITGSVTITTEGSAFDTLLGVYTGTAVNALNEVAANDDITSTNKRSSVTFNAVAGTTYYIAVDGYVNASGNVVVNVTQQGMPPTNSNSRLYNLSIRARAGVNGQPLIVGFVPLNSNGTPILVRGIGPGLTQFNVAGVMADPKLEIHGTVNDSDAVVGSNDNWGAEGVSDMQAAFSSSGAFALSDTASRDSAKLHTATSNRTVHINSVTSGASGVVLVEVYDRGDSSTPRLTNVSARNFCGTGSDIMIAGISINGDSAMQLIIRGVGPGLAQFGVPGTLVDPKLEIHQTVNGVDTIVASNDDWETEAGAASTGAAVGAFALPAGSKDAVLVRTLSPGIYTVQVSGANNGTGETLIEVYEVR